MAGIPNSAAGDNFFFDLINPPTRYLIGVNLVGDGYSIGDDVGLTGTTWDGHNDAIFSFLSFGYNAGGDGDATAGTTQTGGNGGHGGDGGGPTIRRDGPARPACGAFPPA